MMNIICEEYEISHLDGLMETVTALKSSNQYYPKPVDGETLENFLHNDVWAVKKWVAVVDGETVGHVSVRKSFPESLTKNFLNSLTFPDNAQPNEIRGLFVHPKFQHYGVGSLLLDHAVGYIFSTEGSPFLSVKEGLPANSFYVKHGWNVVYKMVDDSTFPATIWNTMFLEAEKFCKMNPHISIIG